MPYQKEFYPIQKIFSLFLIFLTFVFGSKNLSVKCFENRCWCYYFHILKNKLVKVDGLEPPLTESKSIVLPLHHTSLGEGVYPPMLALLGGTLLEVFLRYSHVLWAGLEPAWTYKAFCIATLTLYAILELKDTSTNSVTKASVGHFPTLLNN